MTQSIRRPSRALSTKLSVPDWRDLNEDQPFYDSVTNEYCIVVATDATFASEEAIREARPIVKEKGVENLYKFYNKILPPAAGYEAATQTASASKYYLDSRPCSTLRFLVCVSADIWDTIPTGPPRYLLPVPKSPIVSVVNYNLSTLQNLLNSTAEKLDEYSGEIVNNQDGNVSPDLNLAREAKRLRAVYPSLQKMLLFNDIEVLPADTAYGAQVLQFNFTEDYTLHSVGIRGAGPPNEIARKLDIGFASFNRTFPMKFVRTRRYVATLKQMQEAFECPTPPPWYEFITEYSHKSAYVIDRFSNSRRGQEIIEDVREIFKDTSTVRTGPEMRAQKSAMTAAVKTKAAAKADEKTYFVGNLLLSAGATKEVMDSINTSKEAYEKILNKVDMKYLAGVGMRMLTSETHQEDFNKSLFEASLTVLDYIELNQVATECIDPNILAASGAFDDVDSSCPEDVSAAASIIAQLVAEGYADNECMGRALEKVCPTPARLFGWRGHVENFLEKNTSTFLAYDRENLCPEPSPGGEESPWKIPTTQFPPLPSVTDVSKGIWDSFLKALRLTTDALVVGTIKEILALLLKNFENILCNWSDLRSFGKDRVQSIWEDSKQAPVNHFKDALYDWGIDADALLDPAKPGTTPDEHITNFMNEISECLNPGELRAALSGDELGKNSEVIERAAGEHLVGLDPNDAMDVLAHAARDANLRNLDERTRFDVGQYVCDEINALKFEENFRDSYSDRATPEEIERMLAIERQITADKLRNLASLMNSPYDQMFNDCGVVATPPQDPSNSFMTKAAVDSQFAGIDNSFSQELSSFPRLLTVRQSGYEQEGDYDQIFREVVAGRGFGFPDGPPDDPDLRVQYYERAHMFTRERINERVAAERDGQSVDLTVVEPVVLPGLQKSLANEISPEGSPVLGVTPGRPGRSNLGPALVFKLLSFRSTYDPDTSTGFAEFPDVVATMRYVTKNVTVPLPDNPNAPAPLIRNRDFYTKKYSADVPIEVGLDGTLKVLRLGGVSGLDEQLVQHLEVNRSEFLKDDAKPSRRTPQEIMFSNYIANSLASTFDLSMPRLGRQAPRGGVLGWTADVFGAVSDGANSLYLKTLTSQLDVITNLFASSPLFEVHQELPLKGLFDIHLNQSITCPMPSQSRDNIMKTDYEKKQTELKYNQIISQREAEIASNPDAELPPSRPLQEASIPSILRSIVRIHVADIAVRNIFALSVFKGGSAIFKDDILLKYTKDYTASSLKKFINLNVAAFARLGPSVDPVENFENQLVESGLGTLEDVIVEVSSGVFEEIEKVMAREFPGERRKPLMQAIGDSIGLVPVPETTRFLGAGSPQGGAERAFEIDPFPFRFYTQEQRSADRGDRGDAEDLRNETHYRAGSSTISSDNANRIFLPRPFREDVELASRYNQYGLNERFQHLDGGYFVFEYFIEYEPLRGADVPHNDIFLTMFDGNLQNVEYSTKQVENLEAFKEYFRRAVQLYVQRVSAPGGEQSVLYGRDRGDGGGQVIDLEEAARQRGLGLDPEGQPITPLAKDRAFRQGFPAISESSYNASVQIEEPVAMEEMFFRNNTIEQNNAPVPTLLNRFGTRKLSEYFASLKYGVRLTYVIPDNVDEMFPQMLAPNDGRGLVTVEEMVDIVDPQKFDDLAEIKKAYKVELHTISPPAGGPGDFINVHETQTMCTIPLVEEIQNLPIDRMTIANFYGSEPLHPRAPRWNDDNGYTGRSRQEIFNPSIARLKERLIRNNPDFQILFDFALGSTRLTSLLAIYCMQTGTFTNKSLKDVFHRTKKSLIAAMFAAQPDLPIEEFYKYEDPSLAAIGGSPGLLGNQNRFASTSGPSGNAAAKTVPFIIKGLAEYQDPSYAYAAGLDKAGLLPGGLGPTALAFTLPANVVLGSPLPPVTGLGLSAYALGKLPGEDVSYDERTTGAQGTPTPESNQCEDVPLQEDE